MIFFPFPVILLCMSNIKVKPGKGEKVLLHTCCAPCCAPSGERMIEDGYDITLFYSNSNIYPEKEYQKRRDEAKRLAEIWGVPILEDSWDHREWLDFVKGLEKEPEGGKRCAKCFEFNLHRTAQKAQDLGFPYYTTTLTLGPYKNSRMIFEIAEKFPGFIKYNFKKKNGFLRSIELSKKYNLYRQNYCGCEFSFRNP